ncbi:MAG: ubiquinone/menaquinone biosynthesis methyltransferase [Sedimentisphaerales bacterium]|nr:ubiquinone/menaquinone biosynthesis methyltransferase [Sedimentisphaerales bacterium]
MSSEAMSPIQSMFAEVPATYELVNHVLTFGLDVLWRRKAVRIAAQAGGTKWIDMCTGTGEVAMYLSRLAPVGTEIYAVDFCESMMEKARRKPRAKSIRFVVADIKALPFEDETFDLVTMAFATRSINVNEEILIQSFAEYCRVLKRGGRFVNLETSRPPFWPIRKYFDFHVKLFVEQIGGRISGSRNAYGFLARTIPRFYTAEALAGIMRQAGFEEVTFKRLLFGAAAIHQAVKR